MEVNDEDFQKLINLALEELPGEHAGNLKNVAILFDDQPNEEQRQRLKLDNNHTLLGLYEGTPLSERQGRAPLLPDRITLFKKPLLMKSRNEQELKENIKHTLWHEVAHYYGLNHQRIEELE
ncbi:MAG TPA: metallopeptidase family protein [Candidatus Saccharimonadales bacterium]|nr:metallopeptidase family protein [Candidatus Saccharimonadales bacterium]